MDIQVILAGNANQRSGTSIQTSRRTNTMRFVKMIGGHVDSKLTRNKPAFPKARNFTHIA
jgi:hypothetical protein